MKKYIINLIFCLIIVLQYQSVYAQVDYDISNSASILQRVNKNILADRDLMKTITPEQLENYIARGADVNAKGDNDFTPLILAVIEQNFQIVQLLIDHNADVNARAKYGWTPLMFAVGKQNSKMIQLLINKGAATEIRDHIGNTALMIALLPSVVDLPFINRLSHDKDFDTEAIRIKHNVIKTNIDVLQTLLKNGVNVNIENTNGLVVNNVLAYQFTNYREDEALVKRVGIEEWMSINGIEEFKAFFKTKNDMLLKEAKYGITPLQTAIIAREPEVIETLLKFGANVNIKTTTGNSLLYIADQIDDPKTKKIVKMLLEYGAIPNDKELVVMLKSNGSDENVWDLKDKIYDQWKKYDRIKAKEEFSKNKTGI